MPRMQSCWLLVLAERLDALEQGAKEKRLGAWSTTAEEKK